MANRKRSDDLLIAALARGSTQRDAAVVAGVSERTVHRRMSDPDFKSRLGAEQREVAREATAGLVAMMPKAVETLGDILDNGKDEVRLRAALTIINTGSALRKEAEIEAKFDQLFPNRF